MAAVRDPRIVLLLASLVAAAHAAALPSASPTQAASPSVLPTVLASTRYTIDRFFNSTLGLVTDAPFVSVGAVNTFGDAAGNLAATAVYCTAPTNDANLPYRLTRIDLLMFVKSVQSNRVGVSDFAIQIFADDGSADHAPGALVSLPRASPCFRPSLHALSSPAQIAPPLSLASYGAALVATRAIWIQVDVSTSGWVRARGRG